MKTITKTAAVVLSFLVVTALNAEPKIKDGEVFTYINTVNGVESRGVCTYHNHANGYSYKYVSDRETWTASTDKKGNPSSVTHETQGNRIYFDYNGKSVTMHGMWNGAAVNKSKQFEIRVTSENALLLRTNDFTRNPEITFEMQQPSDYPYLNTIKMKYSFEGIEEITVQAGTFKCKKIKFSPVGFKAFFFSAYYYITDDDRQIIVKSENMPVNGQSELVKITTSQE
ncbi:MAG: hypothetical protein JXK07_04250 [Spirochaetes bacterium]|nr:hypothetical protein [Spirochaetota bacterium]MBN2770930.1 hypothetical protein [Spirochaetota bacterium]